MMTEFEKLHPPPPIDKKVKISFNIPRNLLIEKMELMGYKNKTDFIIALIENSGNILIIEQLQIAIKNLKTVMGSISIDYPISVVDTRYKETTGIKRIQKKERVLTSEELEELNIKKALYNELNNAVKDLKKYLIPPPENELKTKQINYFGEREKNE